MFMMFVCSKVDVVGVEGVKQASSSLQRKKRTEKGILLCRFYFPYPDINAVNCKTRRRERAKDKKQKAKKQKL
jgi:hypothetical protein